MLIRRRVTAIGEEKGRASDDRVKDGDEQ